MLKLIGKAQVEFAMDPFEELGVDKILFLTKPFNVGMGGVIAQTPEIIGIIAVRSLETGYVVLFREEDGRAEDEDQLFSQGIQAQQIDV